MVEEGGMDLMVLADGGDGLPLDEVEAQQPDLFLAGMLAARAWGRVGGPAIA